MQDSEYSYFQRKVFELTGIDLSSYKSEQMRRRLGSIMARSGAKSLFDYHRIIAQNPVKLQEFRDFLTINVSEFFRIPDKFEYLRQTVIPQLMSGQRRLNVWSAGCSNGAEPYSLAIMLTELAPLGRWRILATDIDATVLAAAGRATYSQADLNNVTAEHRAKYFTSSGPSFQLVDRIKNKVEFKRHDLLRDAYEQDFDLILCRHVLIYFTEEAKDEIFKKFNRALRPGGVLFVGGTEMMKRPTDVGYATLSTSFYRKTGEDSPRTLTHAGHVREEAQTPPIVRRPFVPIQSVQPIVGRSPGVGSAARR